MTDAEISALLERLSELAEEVTRRRSALHVLSKIEALQNALRHVVLKTEGG